MNKKEIKVIEENFKITLNDEIANDMETWLRLFKEYNEHTNLISKGDLKLIFEKHIFDSLNVLKYIDPNNNLKIVDVGTGGGFPSLILAIFFRNLKIVAVDSIGKKINFIKEVKDKLNLKNLDIFNDRIENIKPLKADFVVSRAVGRILKIYDFSKKHLKREGKMIFYKSTNYEEELDEFKKKYKKKTEIINYVLPTEEKHERRLIVISQI